jgi:hypothetical protein
MPSPTPFPKSNGANHGWRVQTYDLKVGRIRSYLSYHEIRSGLSCLLSRVVQRQGRLYHLYPSSLYLLHCYELPTTTHLCSINYEESARGNQFWPPFFSSKWPLWLVLKFLPSRSGIFQGWNLPSYQHLQRLLLRGCRLAMTVSSFVFLSSKSHRGYQSQEPYPGRQSH